MSLRIEQLVFAYDERGPVLEGLQLAAGPGELLCLVGPNGSGKSTLLSLCAGLLAPTAGTLQWDGKALSEWPATERARHVAFLPQHLPEVAGHSVEQVVRLGRHPHLSHPWARLSAEDEAAVEDALSKTDALGLRQRPIDGLSGGERQRVFLAAALAQGGELLLLDEPTTALDLHHQIEGMRLLRRLSRGGRCVLCATHDLNLAAAVSDRVLLLREGRAVADGSPEEVLVEENLRELYGEDVWVGPHPAGGGRAILPYPEVRP